MLTFIHKTIRRIKQIRWRLIYREGRTLSRFIAKDVVREVMVISVAEIDEGFITARVKTTNILYLAGEYILPPSFGPPERICIDQVWHWTGQSWGGLPDGTSLVRKSKHTSNDP